MNTNSEYSYEELYMFYGQYDFFINLTFKYKSQAYNDYGSDLSGTIKYTLENRRALQEIISSDNFPKTNRPIYLNISRFSTLTETQARQLNEVGILPSDISYIFALDSTTKNNFTRRGKKLIPNTIRTPVYLSDSNPYSSRLDIIEMRLENGQKLFPEEENQYYGLGLVYIPNFASLEIHDKILDKETKEIKPAIRYYQLETLKYHGLLSEDENKELESLMLNRLKERQELLFKELNKSGVNNIQKTHPHILKQLIKICANYNGEPVIPFEFSIWLDLSSYLHIHIRHVEEFQIGKNNSIKTAFQYNLTDIRRVIMLVIRSVYKDIKQHFKESPTRHFFRNGKESIYYNGNYYQLDIEPSGRLAAFSPKKGV
ncbi:hypothetical protein AHMF7605_19665 [Adhaeribacter arboris]|uniref:Uncharacterized protein n=1 Tax=Adhaeribacter arboris TaxID=2072846 RepID=A0A2T2YJA3_9BACT|nr:hypothetical protein [Adhaeribacter arboris]PSR55565.1 hypothetical protein AHMF7605_19665 [Adhaeribacter arboris]